ncbi:MAG: 3-dehydroquinate synthase [Dehalococcoidia bacterium]
MSNLIITGFSGTGKSLVAKEVARRLNWDFLDIDDEIVKQSGRPIAEIFRQNGEAEFRELERRAIRRACQQGQTVIAVGGGATVDRQNRELLAQSGLLVCLEARPETIYRRLFGGAVQGSGDEVRPLLADADPLERIRQLKASRQRYYAEADWTIHTDGLSIGEVAEEVVRVVGLLGVNHPHLNPLPSRERKWGSEMNAVGSGGRKQRPQGAMDDDVACLVETATESYPVFVGYGLLDKLGEKMKQAAPRGTVIIISDHNVFSLYGSRIEGTVKGAGFAVHSFTVPPGEETKNIDYAMKICDFLVEHRAEREDVIIAVGGGVVGDLAGFVAATFLRGVPWIQVPTSLVAMVDASIGGKVGVNHRQGKNLIGAFYQPQFVLADPQTLGTLPQRELTSGWAEVAKHGLILDREFVGFLEANVSRLTGLDPELLTGAIARSAAIKAGVVSRDEKEKGGERTLLNYGHTIAHGLEAASEYRRFLHGEAVAIGMMGAARLSQRLGLLSAAAVERQQALLREFGLPTLLSDMLSSSSPAEHGNLGLSVASITRAMELDKKVRGKAIGWVLLEDIGRAVVLDDVPEEDVLAVLRGLVEQ